MALEVLGNHWLGFLDRSNAASAFIYDRRATSRTVKAKRAIPGSLRETLLLAVSGSEIQVRLGVGWALFHGRQSIWIACSVLPFFE